MRVLHTIGVGSSCGRCLQWRRKGGMCVVRIIIIIISSSSSGILNHVIRENKFTRPGDGFINHKWWEGILSHGVWLTRDCTTNRILTCILCITYLWKTFFFSLSIIQTQFYQMTILNVYFTYKIKMVIILILKEFILYMYTI